MTTDEQAVKPVKPIKSTKDMREFLLNQMRGVAEGSVNTYQAKGVCNLAQQVYNTINIEIKYAQAMDKLKDKSINAIKL